MSCGRRPSCEGPECVIDRSDSSCHYSINIHGVCLALPICNGDMCPEIMQDDASDACRCKGTQWACLARDILHTRLKGAKSMIGQCHL